MQAQFCLALKPTLLPRAPDSLLLVCGVGEGAGRENGEALDPGKGAPAPAPPPDLLPPAPQAPRLQATLSGTSALPSGGRLAQGDNSGLGVEQRPGCQVKYSHRNLSLFLQRGLRRTALLSLLWFGRVLGSAGCHPNPYCRII